MAHDDFFNVHVKSIEQESQGRTAKTPNKADAFGGIIDKVRLVAVGRLQRKTHPRPGGTLRRPQEHVSEPLLGEVASGSDPPAKAADCHQGSANAGGEVDQVVEKQLRPRRSAWVTVQKR